MMGGPDRRREVVPFGGDVEIDVIAEGAGPLVVLLPSRGRGSEDFDDLAAGIAAHGFRVLRPQPRGAGRSRGPLDGIGMPDLALDVARVIEREGAGPAVLAGHAFGSWVARQVATAHPGLVAGIVLVAASARTFPPDLAKAVADSGNLELAREQRLAALRRAFFLPGHDPEPWLEGWAPDAHHAQTIAVAATPQHSYWHAGTAPILELIPEHDPFKPREKWGESRAELGPRVETVIIPGASHALIPEQPQAVIDAIVPWARAKLGSSKPL